jgi:hypothetical protein
LISTTSSSRSAATAWAGRATVALVWLHSYGAVTVDALCEEADVNRAASIPVVAVVWNYPGLSAEEMERRVVIISERAHSTTVGGAAEGRGGGHCERRTLATVATVAPGRGWAGG